MCLPTNQGYYNLCVPLMYRQVRAGVEVTLPSGWINLTLDVIHKRFEENSLRTE